MTKNLITAAVSLSLGLVVVGPPIVPVSAICVLALAISVWLVLLGAVKWAHRSAREEAEQDGERLRAAAGLPNKAAV